MYCDLFCSLQVQRASELKETYIPFYKLFTPRDILTRAQFTTRYYNYTSTAITFGRGTSYRRLFKLPLLPVGLLTRYADIVVKITVGLQSSIRHTSRDSDPKFLLSDGVRGMGFEMREEAVRCQGIQGLMGNTLTSRSTRGGASHASSILPEEFVLTMAPTQRWGSCFFAVDSGLISPVYYTQRIYPDQGLWLEVYGENYNEYYTINYIIIEIHEN